ncbi:MAG: phenylacetic acid degradation operon negative regulatory protein PaaX [Rhodocyclaceae bacterium]|nr:MAG: phenylacetic acid degradation operon negative regulatory protein PaaX [Rhodocyclaceae bacterium]
MKNRSITQWIDSFLAERKLRANSIIITVYGDSIEPHGGTVWLGSFIRLVESLGLNQRMVRTSVFRLAKEKWLVAEQIGRKSFYSLTASGRRRFEHAYRRIYDEPAARWEGGWQIAMTTSGKLSASQRDALRKDLLWEGFGVIAPGVLAHPSDNNASLIDILHENEVHEMVVVMQARTLGALTSRPLQELVRDCWNLKAIAQDYQRFIKRFQPVMRALKSAEAIDPEQCFVVRTLLMHEFRRVLLRDPQLPQQLLPKDWPGETARRMCRELYSVTQCGAEQHLMEILETIEGPLPQPAEYFFQRFGGVLSKDCRQEAA